MTISFRRIYLMPLLLSIALYRSNSGCPDSCFCKWRNGKQTVECPGRSLLIIPKGIGIGTQVLDASGNNLQYIQRDNFLRLGLTNLQKLFLNRCGIKMIHEEAFTGLPSLVELDLSENMLKSVPTEAFQRCPSLIKLNLNKNPIEHLDKLAFNHLSFLTTLDLSGCEINRVDEAAFSNLHSLEWIDLSRNKLRFFPDMRLFPTRLKGVQLQDNPWTCDCHIKTFNSWLKQDVVPILIPPLCWEPENLRGILVRGLDQKDLRCAPEVALEVTPEVTLEVAPKVAPKLASEVAPKVAPEVAPKVAPKLAPEVAPKVAPEVAPKVAPEVAPATVYFELEEKKNITLKCQVKSTPRAKITWIFKGQTLQNNSEPIPGLHLVYFIDEGAEKQESSLFIYNLNSENNSTFYCIAENPAGVATGNYTVVVILKQTPIRLEEEEKEEKQFSLDLWPIFLILGLVAFSLCFGALLMALVKQLCKSKGRKSNFTMPIEKTAEQRKSILKTSRKSSNKMGIFDVQGSMAKNSDVVNGLNREDVNTITNNNTNNNNKSIDLPNFQSNLVNSQENIVSRNTIIGRNLITDVDKNLPKNAHHNFLSNDVKGLNKNSFNLEKEVVLNSETNSEYQGLTDPFSSIISKSQIVSNLPKVRHNFGNTNHNFVEKNGSNKDSFNVPLGKEVVINSGINTEKQVQIDPFSSIIPSPEPKNGANNVEQNEYSINKNLEKDEIKNSGVCGLIHSFSSSFSMPQPKNASTVIGLGQQKSNTASNLSKPILVAPAPINANRKVLSRNRTQPYLKPTLTSKSRPVSAPTFERYVENCDLPFITNGYQDNVQIGRQFSYSENSTPNMRKSRKVRHEVMFGDNLEA